MSLQNRLIYICEQPEVLIASLQQAILVDDNNEPLTPSKQLIHARRLFQPEKPQFMGVPHGVTQAIVLVQDLEVRWVEEQPLIYFCRSTNYRVIAPTITDADNGQYPHQTQCLVSGNRIPGPGFCNGRLRVSVNGRVQVHFEKLIPVTAAAVAF